MTNSFETAFPNFELLIAKKIEAILSPYHFDVIYDNRKGTFHILKDFVGVGEFEFQHYNSKKSLTFHINVLNFDMKYNHLEYGLNVKDPNISSFLSALKGNLEFFLKK